MSISRRGQSVLSILFVLGFTQLAFLLGAAVMLLRLPSSEYLSDAFVAYEGWVKRRHDIRKNQQSNRLSANGANALVDHPDETSDGFTLFMCEPGRVTALVDMHGNVLHRWNAAFSHVFPPGSRSHVRDVVDDVGVCSFSGHLYPNGDLLVVYHGWAAVNPLNGFGLAKLDKDSNVIWRYADNIHHDVDVGEDGTIYAIHQHLIDDPVPGFEYLPKASIIDELVILSPDGKKIDEIPLLEAFRNSPRYAALLGVLERDVHRGVYFPEGGDAGQERRDVLHTNHVEVLPSRLADRFPMFQPGQLLISMRHTDIIAVIDPKTKSVVWAAQGPWHAQHDPRFLNNGHLLIFDNEGLSGSASRVLEYDPQAQSFPWTFSGKLDLPFYTFERGMAQRLDNGNTLIVDTHGRQILEVSAKKELVWRLPTAGDVNFARRYSPEQVSFLDKKVR